METAVIAGLVALIVGAVLGYFFGERKARETNRTEKTEAESEAKRILSAARDEAQSLAQSAEIDAKQVALTAQEEGEKQRKELLAEQHKTDDRLAKREANQQKKEANLDKRESNLDKRATGLDRRDEELGRRDKALLTNEKSLEKTRGEIKKAHDEAKAKLATIAGMRPSEAKEQIIEAMTSEAKADAARQIKSIEDEAIAEADRRAKKIIGIAIQRYAGDYVTDRVVSVVPLPSDDMKGRIIGREGRNIRALEAATGINLIVDDTPEAVILSGFDPIRREVARVALTRLLGDGRIHPRRIEEVVEKSRDEVNQVIKDAGEHAAFELGLHGIHPELLFLLGRLKYRTSYGQNQWSHSIEVGFLCGMMAAELGLNVKMARRAGVLHDIGKALTHEMEGSHALIGGDFCKKHGEDPIIINAVAAHHEDVPPKSVYAHLVMAGDALSGARPGARREILETYVQRIEDMERIACSFTGVQKSYAIQAGREIRVLVEHAKVDDAQALVLSKDIARKIEQELVYPGQVRVCVIRETRAVEYAR